MSYNYTRENPKIVGVVAKQNITNIITIVIPMIEHILAILLYLFLPSFFIEFCASPNVINVKEMKTYT